MASLFFTCHLKPAENNDFEIRALEFDVSSGPNGLQFDPKSPFVGAYPPNQWASMIPLVKNHTQVSNEGDGILITGTDDAQNTGVMIAVSVPKDPVNPVDGEVDIYTKANGNRPMEVHLNCLGYINP